MGVHGSVAPDATQPEANIEKLVWHRGQWLGIGACGLLLIAFLGVVLNTVQFNYSDGILLGFLATIFLIVGSLVVWGSHLIGQTQVRSDNKLRELVDQQWIDSTCSSISAPFKSTIIPDKIAEIMIGGLGPTLGVDVVLFYAFPDYPMPKLWKQWRRRPAPDTEESLFADFESDLSDLIKRLWGSNQVIVVDDSNSVNISRDPIPGLTAIARERGRSWVLAPLGEGSYVLGCIGVGMVENARVWTTREISLIQKVASEVGNAFIHARMITQETHLAKNAQEVSRLVDLDRVKSRLIEDINHELRTPLTSIIGYMEVIMNDVASRVDPELVASLAAVQRNALRLQILIDNMTQISRSDFEHVSLDVSTVDIGHMLDDVIRSMEPTANDCGVEMVLRLDSPADDLLIDGDVDQLERVFVNLVSNAIKFTPRDGMVTVVARCVNSDGGYVEVQVIDTGIGIPTKEFPKVFKRFFRASTATQASIPGFGIGLSLVQLIVYEHHGTITFDSTVGQGTVFTVRLPARYLSIPSRDATA